MTFCCTTIPKLFDVIFLLTVNLPKIFQHPKKGSTAVDFTIKVTGYKLLFQWKKNGHVMGDNGKYIGAKTLTLQIVAVEESITIAW